MTATRTVAKATCGGRRCTASSGSRTGGGWRRRLRQTRSTGAACFRRRRWIPPEHQLKSLVLIALYSIRSERQFCDHGRGSAAG